MKISYQQLALHLKQNFAPVYLITGDEHFLVQEALDQIRNVALQKEFTAREKFFVETGFNWQDFLLSVDNLSLLSEPTIVELKFSSAKLGDEGIKIISSYLTNPAKDKIVIMIMPKIDAATQKTKWFKALENAAVVVQIWPLETAQFPVWIANKAKQAGILLEPEGIKILADFVAGNLLAAVQEIEKLLLLYCNNESHLQQNAVNRISTVQLIAAITDNARFDMFDLVDQSLAGNGKQVVRILDSLRDEGAEPVLILWAIAREVRSLINLKNALQQSNNFETVASQYHINFKRKAIIKNALQKHSLANLEKILFSAGDIDLVIKGIKSGNVWQEMQNVCLALANVQIAIQK